MKDVQGIQRGKCNSCECAEYRAPPEPGRLRCEYCNHTPGEHVRIIALGHCNTCGKEDCDKYESDDPNEYTECQYCGCEASEHAGAEKLLKPKESQPVAAVAQPTAGTYLPPQSTVPPGAQIIQPRMSASGQVGTCSFPGCPYPKRVENGRVHDYCSRTCARKDAARFQGPSHSHSGPPPQAMLYHQPQGLPRMGGGPGRYGGGGAQMCKQCSKHAANPGSPLCQLCSVQKSHGV